MEELTYVNPYTWESERASASTKVKRRTTKRSNKRRPPGTTPMDACINKMRKLHKSWEKERADHEAEFRLSCKLPERDVSLKPFTEQPFGTLYTPDSCGGLCGLSQEVASELSSSVVAIALFDGNIMLFACTGLALPYRTAQLQRFLTSACLVDVFNAKRNREDSLNISVCLPNKKIINGFLELYDKDIAIITSLTFTCVPHVDLYSYTPHSYSMLIVAAGRSFDLCGLMATCGTLQPENIISDDCSITEAALGGPIVDLIGNFLGMNVRCGSGIKCFIPKHVILQRLYQFRLLEYNPRNVQGGDYATKECTYDSNPHGAGTSVGGTKTSSQVYSMPPGAMKIKPSGFLRNLNMLTQLGYPEPPPLMLELNGGLINKFEEDFGYLYAWSGYPYNLDFCGDGMNAWARLDAKTITTISRRVVSLSSYNGLLIKYPANTDSGSRSQTVILTSASLARACDEPDTIVKNLRIEVFLPPKQRAIGTLKSYDSHHNIAIVSFKGLRATCAEDIFNLESSELRPEHVVAVGREPDEGLLCASTGKLTDEPITALPCKHLKLSTCKIKKAGIGGPLINFNNGSFIGMNFFYGNSQRTPFLPRSKIVDVLKELDLLSGSAIQMEGDHPASRLDCEAESNSTKRWPVPKAYWWSAVLEMDWAEGRKFIDHPCCVCKQCLSWRQPSAVTCVHPSESLMDLEATSESLMELEVTCASTASVVHIRPSQIAIDPKATSASSASAAHLHLPQIAMDPEAISVPSHSVSYIHTSESPVDPEATCAPSPSVAHVHPPRRCSSRIHQRSSN